MIPCFHESRRVALFLRELCQAIEESGLRIGLQLVDDGSGDDEVKRLRKVVADCRNDYSFLTEVFALERNKGKGAAIRSGWALAPDEARLLGFVDADGSVSATETIRLLQSAITSGDPALVIASRGLPSSRVERSVFRRFIAGGFTLLVRISYGIQIKDTQCGCKFLTACWYRDHYLEFREDGFGFDLELILKAKEMGCPIEEIGVVWHEVAGSSVGPREVYSLGQAILKRRIGSVSKK